MTRAQKSAIFRFKSKDFESPKNNQLSPKETK